MQVSVAVGQVPVCWSVSRNLATILATIGGVPAGTLLILPEAALSGYDDQLSGLDGLDPGELAQARDAYLTQQRGDVVSITYLTTPGPQPHTPA